MNDDDDRWVLADEWTLLLEVPATIPLGQLDEVRIRLDLVLAALAGSRVVAPGRLRLDGR